MMLTVVDLTMYSDAYNHNEIKSETLFINYKFCKPECWNPIKKWKKI